MLPSSYDDQDCALARALEVVGERWTLLIVRDAFYGVRRFKDFVAHLDVPRAVLAARLRSLQQAGIVERSAVGEYILTQDGLDLWPAVHALVVWGRRFQEPGHVRGFRHVTCTTSLAADGRCPDCGGLPPSTGVVTTPPRRTVRQDPVSTALRSAHRLGEPLIPTGA